MSIIGRETILTTDREKDRQKNRGRKQNKDTEEIIIIR